MLTRAKHADAHVPIFSDITSALTVCELKTGPHFPKT